MCSCPCERECKSLKWNKRIYSYFLHTFNANAKKTAISCDDPFIFKPTVLSKIARSVKEQRTKKKRTDVGSFCYKGSFGNLFYVFNYVILSHIPKILFVIIWNARLSDVLKSPSLYICILTTHFVLIVYLRILNKPTNKRKFVRLSGPYKLYTVL
jgi:hypothetical protein